MQQQSFYFDEFDSRCYDTKMTLVQIMISYLQHLKQLNFPQFLYV